jgi:hypothetical protein
MEDRMPVVEQDMDTLTEAPAVDPVGFIDAWLADNALWLDVRTMDFALDLRSMVADGADDPDTVKEPVGADA